MAMVELAARGGERPVSLAQLAQAQDIPLPYLEQIFARLRRGGLVASVRGPGGGYALTRTPQAICIADVVGAVDEPLKMTRCEGHQANGCMPSRARCATHDLWDGLGNQIHNYLSSISLEDVCQRRLAGMAETRLAG